VSTYERPGWFRLEVPLGWDVEEEEGGAVSVFDPEGPGVMQVSIQDPRPLKAGQRLDPYLMLRAFLTQSGVDFDLSEPRRWTVQALDWAACEYDQVSTEDPDVTLRWRAWMATNHDLIAFITYACPETERDLEREKIDEVAASLELG
jgi:hypothetical protein